MNPPFIGKATLEQARALLSQARNELEPRQWELLDGKLTEAERSFERFNRVADASGRVAQVAKGAEGVAETGRAGEALEGVGAAARTGPLLALMILLWPSETAGPEYDHGPDWLPPEQEFKERLREVSKAAQQIRSELAATRWAPPVEAAKRSRPSKPNKVSIPDENWTPAPGEPKEPPCSFVGGGGDGASQPSGPGWVRCTYVCGKYEVVLYDVWGSSTKECEKAVHLVRAKREAENWARVNEKGR